MDHYFSQKPKSNFKRYTISANLRGMDLEFESGSGTFSIKKIDKGSTLLIEKAILEERWRILDLGCGYGAVGITIAKSFPSSEIVMTDINERAVSLAKKNSKDLSNVLVKRGDGFEKIEGVFDCILFNPPQTAGKDICFKLIKESKQFLKKGGNIQIVARHQKGGKDLSKFMGSVFGNVSDVAKGSGYRVYISLNKD